MKLMREYDLAPDEKGRTRWQFSFSHAAMRELERITNGTPFWATLIDERESATRLIQLAWAATLDFRLKAIRKPEMTSEEFEAFLPDLLSDEWFRFQDFINNLVIENFLRAAEDRIWLQTLRAVQMTAALGNVSEQLIGTTESGPPSNSSECPPTNSGMTGTG
jgi:hypothetical protein